MKTGIISLLLFISLNVFASAPKDVAAGLTDMKSRPLLVVMVTPSQALMDKQNKKGNTAEAENYKKGIDAMNLSLAEGARKSWHGGNVEVKTESEFRAIPVEELKLWTVLTLSASVLDDVERIGSYRSQVITLSRADKEKYELYKYQRADYYFPVPFSTDPDGNFTSNEMATLLLIIQQVGSSRVDLQACKLEYSIVSPK